MTTVNQQIDALLKRRGNPALKTAASMSAAQINSELDRIDGKWSALNDELIAAGRGHERANETLQKSDPLAMRFRALSDRRADLMYEVRRRAGPGVYRLPKGFGPMKNPVRKPRTAARSVVLVAAKNPARKDWRAVVPMPDDSEPLGSLFSYYVQWFNTVSGKWRSIAAFANEDDAVKYATAFAKTARGVSKTIRVAMPDR